MSTNCTCIIQVHECATDAIQLVWRQFHIRRTVIPRISVGYGTPLIPIVRSSLQNEISKVLIILTIWSLIGALTTLNTWFVIIGDKSVTLFDEH